MNSVSYIVVFSHAHWFQVELEAKNIQLQEKEGLIEQHSTELQEKATLISRQQRELQMLRVCKT